MLIKSARVGVTTLNFTRLIAKILYWSFMVSDCGGKWVSGDIPDSDLTHPPWASVFARNELFSASASPSLTSHPQWQYREPKRPRKTPHLHFRWVRDCWEESHYTIPFPNLGNQPESDAQTLMPPGAPVLMVQATSQVTIWQNTYRHVNSVAIDLPDDFMEELYAIPLCCWLSPISRVAVVTGFGLNSRLGRLDATFILEHREEWQEIYLKGEILTELPLRFSALVFARWGKKIPSVRFGFTLFLGGRGRVGTECAGQVYSLKAAQFSYSIWIPASPYFI